MNNSTTLKNQCEPQTAVRSTDWLGPDDPPAFGDCGKGRNGEPRCTCGGDTFKTLIVEDEDYWECEDCGTTWP